MRLCNTKKQKILINKDNLLIAENSDDEKVWYAMQLLKTEIASGSSSKTLPKMIINQVNEKVCDKLKLLDYEIEQEVLDLWCKY